MARELEAPEIIKLCKLLTPVYVESRYVLGEEKFKKFTKKESKEDIKTMEKIVKWAKKIYNKNA